MPYKLFVDDSVQKLSNIAEKTIWALAGRILLAFSPFFGGSYEGFLPRFWCCAC